MMSLLNLFSVFCVLLGFRRLLSFSALWQSLLAPRRTGSCQAARSSRTQCIENLQRFSTSVYGKDKRSALGIMRGRIYLSFWKISSTGGQEQLVQMSWICRCHLDMGTPALGTKLAFSLDLEKQKPSCLLRVQQSLCRETVYFVVQLLWPSGALAQSMRMAWALLTFGDSVTVSDSKTSGKRADLLLRRLQVS